MAGAAAVISSGGLAAIPLAIVGVGAATGAAASAATIEEISEGTEEVPEKLNDTSWECH